MADKKQIDRILYNSGYVINETPKYRPVIDDSSFDSIPEGWNVAEANEEPSLPKTPETPSPAGNMSAPAPAAPAEPAPTSAAPAAAPTPPPAAPTNIIPDQAPAMPPAEPAAPMAMDAPVEPQQSTDQLQADLMRFQLDAMKKMSSKIDQLENVIAGLNSQQATLHAEVEKVKDPSDVEKFAERKQDSSPYYFNLNDMWNGNTFQARMDNYNSDGIMKTKDGYVGDYSKMPKMSSFEVKDSFDQI